MIKGLPITSPNVKGRKFVVVDYLGGHNYPLNKILTFKKDFGSSQGNDMAVEITGGNIINMSSCQLIDLSVPTLKIMIEQNLENIKEIENQNKSLEEKIRFCEQEGLNEYSEIAFRVKETMNILKTRTSEREILEDVTKLITNEVTI